VATGPDPNPVYRPPWLGGRLLQQKKKKKNIDEQNSAISKSWIRAFSLRQ